MNIEEEIFKKSICDFKRLEKYGFIKEGNTYVYKTTLKDNEFAVTLKIDENSKVTGKIYDTDTNEEYTNFRMENENGFSQIIRDEYINILKDIKKNCFIEKTFIYDQSNRIAKLISEKYSSKVESLWDKFPGYGVFRNKETNKWFGIIMNVDKSKLINKTKGEVEILCIKLGDKTNDYLKVKGIYEAYYMNKKNWVSIILDDTLTDEEIMKLANISYKLS